MQILGLALLLVVVPQEVAKEGIETTVASMTKEAKKRMSKYTELPNVIVMGNPEWRPSLVGLVANSVASCGQPDGAA